MIPDKIYLPVVEEERKRLLSTIWWPEDNRPSNEKFVVDAIPYIRKDALIEWAKEQKKWRIECDYEGIRYASAIHALNHLIDKLNSM